MGGEDEEGHSWQKGQRSKSTEIGESMMNSCICEVVFPS